MLNVYISLVIVLFFTNLAMDLISRLMDVVKFRFKPFQLGKKVK